MSWIGGKKSLRELIVTLFPLYYERYIEVFGGGGWVLFHKLPGNDFEVYNDFNGLLVNLYRCVREKPQELMAALAYCLNSRADFELVKNALARASPAKVVIENKDFEKLIGQYDRPVSFFYCDPPYFETESYYKNVGEDGFTEKDHIRLRDALLQIGGKFLLSYNDCEFIRSLYDAPGIQTEAFTRINNIKQRYDNGAQFPEILIANYDLHEREKNAPSQLNLFGEGGFME